MITTEEQITFLAQQLNAMQTDVAEFQNALQGQATRCRYADLMVQLFTSEPKVRMVIKTGGVATAVMSRWQALLTRSTGAMTSVAKKRQKTSPIRGVATRAVNRAQHSRWNCRIGSDHCTTT